MKRYPGLLSNADIHEYIQAGVRLYSKLIGPVSKYLTNNSKLIIIPDDILDMLPFEALISDTNGSHQPWNIRFLIRDFEVCYHYSATLWAMTGGDSRMDPVQNTGSKKFIGFSPSFNSPRSELPYAKEEIIRIATLLLDHGIGAISVTGDKATESHFKETASLYSWIHLATHSLINMNDPGRSGLKFSQPGKTDNKNPGDDGTLRFDEICQLRLKADLVVLSACASGNGKLFRSEGLMGLTRAFIFAGASNVLFSIWNVTDRNTRDFMVGFYDEILSGKSYTSAIRAEKIRMISQPETSLPLIWAPFVMIGL